MLQERTYTVEEFWEFAQLPENADKRLELIDGVMVEMPPSSNKNTILAMEIGSHLQHFNRQHRLGFITGADGGFQLSPTEVRLPDVAFISKQRANIEGKVFSTAPDLAVEVISPSESHRQIMDKVKAYLSAGSQLVWVVYPDEQVVDVWQLAESGMNVQTYTRKDTLDGGPVLPSFKLAVNDLFSVLDQQS